jgi:hypothetical protein
MKRSHPFRFKKVRRSGGHTYVVIYDVNPSRPRSTGIAVDPRDGRASGPGYDAAVAWAYANARSVLSSRLTLEEATRDLFTERCSWRRRITAKGRTFSSTYFDLHRMRLLSYVWPRWGRYHPNQVRPAEVDEWLLTLPSATTGAPLAPAM